jgi:ribosome-associated protein
MHIVVLDVRGLTSFTDFLVVASGTSDRQVRAIGENIEKTVSLANGPKTIGREGYATGDWVLVDFGEVVVHLFNDDQRQFFDLESLWSSAPRLLWDPKNPPKDIFLNEREPRLRVAAAGGRAPRQRRAAT